MIGLPLELYLVIRKKCIIRIRKYLYDFKEILVLRYWSAAVYFRIQVLVLKLLLLFEEVMHRATSLINFQVRKNGIICNRYSS